MSAPKLQGRASQVDSLSRCFLQVLLVTSNKKRLIPAIALVWVLPALSLAQTKSDLSQLELEDLVQVKVVSASRHPEDLRNVAAAMMVISREDIDRSGAQSIPELLRLVPGFHVAELSSSRWSVSARGFPGRFSNKLLVLVDGRSVYSPVFAGVYWEAMDIDLSDIERIEVIRGPGGSLWGSNAVNGVVNILTRKPTGVELGRLAIGGGDLLRSKISFSRELPVGSSALRVYGRMRELGGLLSPVLATGDAVENLRSGHIGFRLDRESGGSSLSIQGKLQSSAISQMNLDPISTEPYVSKRSGVVHHDIGVLSVHRTDNSPKVSRHISLDFESQNLEDLKLNVRSQSWTAGIQQTHAVGRADLSLGADLRSIRLKTAASPMVSMGTPDRNLQYISAYATLAYRPSDSTSVTAGLKAERNTFTGWELQPNLRVSHRLSNATTVWGALTRAVRTPSLADTDASIVTAGGTNEGLPYLAILYGNPDFKSESVAAKELGIRTSLSERKSLDISIYQNRLTDLRGQDMLTPIIDGDPPALTQPLLITNRFSGTTAGLELAYRERLVNHGVWGLKYQWYSEKLTDRRPGGGPLSTYGEDGRGQTPRHEVGAYVSVNLDDRLRVGATLLFTGGDIANEVKPIWLGSLRFDYAVASDQQFALTISNVLNSRNPQNETDLGDPQGRSRRSIAAFWERRF